jgi:hypothetical protein
LGYWNDGRVYKDWDNPWYPGKREEDTLLSPVDKTIQDGLKQNGTELRAVSLATNRVTLAETTYYIDGTSKDDIVISVPFME